jgi:hypothetical protein
MKKIIKITERQLEKLVKGVINEQLTKFPGDSRSGYITKGFDTGIIFTNNNFPKFKFVGFDSKPVQVVNTSPNPQKQTESVCEIVVTDNTSELVNYLKGILGFSLGSRLKRVDNKSLGDEFNIINTKFRKMENEFLSKIGFAGDSENTNDKNTWVDENIPNLTKEQRNLFLNELKNYIKLIRNYSKELIDQGVIGFPTFPLPTSFKTLTDTVVIHYQLQIPGHNTTPLNDAVNVFLDSLGKQYFIYLTEQLKQGADTVTIPNVNQLMNLFPSLLSQYNKLPTSSQKVTLKKITVFLKTSLPKELRYV